MLDPQAQVGVSGTAIMRAADAMLRALGGDQITLVFPLATLPNDPTVQLGMVDPRIEQVAFSPVVIRNLVAPSSGPRQRLEFLLSGSAIAAELSSRNVASAQDLFAGALGIMYDGQLFHIENVTTEYFAGAAYLYRVVGVE